jgi:hypothetical protein
MMAVNSRVEANGREKWMPNSLKRKSPGKRPMPNFSSQGKILENTTNTTKITITQRIINGFQVCPGALPPGPIFNQIAILR